MYIVDLFIFKRIKKGEGRKKCHGKTMMITKDIKDKLDFLCLL